DSFFIATMIDYDIWEYPILRQDKLEGHMVIIRPRKNPLANGKPCLVNCTVSGGIPTNFPARSFTIARPDHEPGNLLSWQVGVGASDVLTPIYNSNYESNIGPNEWYMSWEDIKDTVSSTKWFAGVDITVTGQRTFPPVLGAGSVKTTFEGSYRHDSNTTLETGFDESTGLRFYYNDPLIAESDFQVASLVYWARPFPFMRVNWLMNVPTDPTSLWGQYYGTLPDPTLILRHRPRYFATIEPRLRYLEFYSEDIRFAPAAPLAGQPVLITGTVRNYSYVPVNGTLPIVFYDGNPAQGGVPIATTSVNGLGALTAADVHIRWTPPAGSAGCHTIWMVIDPQQTVPAIHRDNKQGFTILPVLTSSSPQQDDPCSGNPGNALVGHETVSYLLSGASQPPDIGFRPGDLRLEPSTNPTKTLVATVRAEQAHFANVHVEFFDGHPQQGGRFIGAEVVPLVWAGRSATARATWPTTRLYGRHEVFARIRWFSPEHDRYENNLVSLRVELAPWPFGAYLPLTWLGIAASPQGVLPGRPQPTTRRRSPRQSGRAP
ncbi:MAG: hypothetical protein K6U89_04470, partial [Chloroflexi bacterium]|nr:hypothetical protein [Chloroflexota bacterium]